MDRASIRPWLIGGSLFVAGLALGLVLGRNISSPGAQHSRVVGSQTSTSSAETVQARAAGTHDSESRTKIVLGNITTIPFQELYSVLSSRPPSELIALARQLGELPANRESSEKISTFFKAWAHFGPKAALDAAGTLKASTQRESALGAIIEGADTAAAASIAKSISALPADSFTPHTQRLLVGKAAEKWSQTDPAAAAAFIDTIPNSPGSFFGDVHTIAQNWAASDPASALAWAQRHDGSDAAPIHLAVSGAIGGWWQKDPRAAEEYVASHLNTLADRQLAATVASQIFNADPQRAMQWVSQLPDLEARRQADTIIAHQIGWTDPKGAAEWAAGLPDDVRSITLESAVSLWAQGNAAAASEWIGTLSGPTRDQATKAYSNVVANSDPANALNWATSISDPRMRDSSINGIVRKWMERDPAGASAWVQASTLSADQKQRLLATPPGG